MTSTPENPGSVPSSVPQRGGEKGICCHGAAAWHVRKSHKCGKTRKAHTNTNTGPPHQQPKRNQRPTHSHIIHPVHFIPHTADASFRPGTQGCNIAAGLLLGGEATAVVLWRADSLQPHLLLFPSLLVHTTAIHDLRTGMIWGATNTCTQDD